MDNSTTPQDDAAMSPASAGSVAGKPVAWMVTDPSGRIEACRESFGEAAQLATDFTATEDGDVVYKVFAVYSQPQPSLTGMERDAVNAAMELVGTQTIKATLRGLLERMK